MLGDDLPADEINRVRVTGQHFGFPYIHAGDVPDPKLGRGRRATDFEPPMVKVQAHAAPLGAAFYDASQFPAGYRHALFVAEHGSWNRSEKVGYQVSVMRFVGDGIVYEPFATGWLAGQRVFGRPADVLVEPGGSLLISDDGSGSIFRVSFYGDQGG